jgi:quercetin dioxygenase-like cupin family protein
LKILGIFPILAALACLLNAQQVPVPVEEEPYHHVVLRNDSVIVLHVTVPPGKSTLYHTHSHDRVAVGLSDSTIAQQELNQPEEQPTSSKPGRVSARQEDKPYTHRVHNVGTTPFEVVDVELRQRPQQPSGDPAEPVVAENPSARVYKYVLAPGASSAMHTHERAYLVVAATAIQLKMTAPDGKSLAHEIKPGEFHWVDSKVTHTLTNEGPSEGQIVEIELK